MRSGVWIPSMCHKGHGVNQIQSSSMSRSSGIINYGCYKLVIKHRRKMASMLQFAKGLGHPNYHISPSWNMLPAVFIVTIAPGEVVPVKTVYCMVCGLAIVTSNISMS